MTTRHPGSFCKRCDAILGERTLVLASVAEGGSDDDPIAAICHECLTPEESARVEEASKSWTTVSALPRAS